MVSTIIEQLASLGSKQFVISAFVPALVFGGLNATLLYFENLRFRAWAVRVMTLEASVEGLAVLVGIAVVAYVLWGLTAFLGDVLSGRPLPARISDPLLKSQRARLAKLQSDYQRSRNERASIAVQRPRWVKKLSDDGVAGLAAGANTYVRTGASGTALNDLSSSMTAALPIGVKALAQAVEAFGAELRAHSLQVARPDGSNPLADDHRELLTGIDYAVDRWGSEELTTAAEMQVRFGTQYLAPTAFGNVSEALRSYGHTRYGINVPTAWSRLQPLLAAETAFTTTLQGAKAQLDFSIVSCWLAIASTVIWAVVLPVWGESPLRFVLVMLMGPGLARLAYLAAVEYYVAFADVVRSGVDLYRFRLLDAMSVKRPWNLAEERRIWQALQLVTDFGQPSLDIGYVASKAAPQ